MKKKQQIRTGSKTHTSLTKSNIMTNVYLGGNIFLNKFFELRVIARSGIKDQQYILFT